MSGALIGALRVTLGIDASQFEDGAKGAERALGRLQKDLQKTGQKIAATGQSMATYITLPILGAGAAVLKTAGDFEAGMNRVAISTQASAKEMKAMRDLALDIGKTTTMSARESADAMDMLAKAGVSAKDILGGAARATVALAEAAGSSLEPAAAAITDSMQQFGLTVEQLPAIINNITGAVNESKFGFEDFQLGMAQAGGVASSAGLEFEEFTAALAATASQFASGSDAGTSMKTFLLSLTPATKKAKAAFDEVGFSAYDAEGKMKPLAVVAEELKQKFGGLSEQDLNATFKEMFGTDAIRTAIGLMKEGGAGIEEMQARIAKTDAAAQAAQRMKGLNAEMEKLSGALETLAIKIADSGLLSGITSVVTAVGEWVEWMAQANPETLKWGAIIAGVVAVIGPLLIGIGAIVSAVGTMLPIILAIGGAITTFAGIITAGAIPALASLLVALAPILIPLGLIAAAVGVAYLAWKNWDKIVPIVQAMASGALAWIQKLVSGVKEWIGNKLTAIFDGVKAKIKAVGQWFYELYDAVVGHSYVPDLIDGIAENFAKLDKVMLGPAEKATKKTAEAFKELAQEVKSLTQRLFPEAAALAQFRTEVEVLEKAMKSGLLTKQQYDEAMSRLSKEQTKDADSKAAEKVARDAESAASAAKQKAQDLQSLMDELFPEEAADRDRAADVDRLTEALYDGRIGAEKYAAALKIIMEDAAKDSEDKTARIIENFANMARDVVDSLRGMVSSFKKGDILGGILGMLDAITSIAGVAKGFGWKGFKGGGTPNIPGFSTGGNFKVGGSGGVDSQLVQFRATPGEMVNVDRTGGGVRNGGAIAVYVTKGDMFDAHVERVAAPLAHMAAARGALGGAMKARMDNAKARQGSLI